MEINSKFKGKKILAWDENLNEFTWVSPRVLTSTVYTEKGETLDDILKVTPAEVIEKVNNILAGAPEAYDSFLEVSKALNENKDSIQEIFREISTKVKKPDVGKEGQVLKLSKDDKIIFADDNDTVYVHPGKHPASIIEENEQKQFISKVEKDKIIDLEDKKLDKDGNLDSCTVNYNGHDTNILEALQILFACVQGINNNASLYMSFMNSAGKANGIAQLDDKGKLVKSQVPSIRTIMSEEDIYTLLIRMSISSDSKKVSVRTEGVGINTGFQFPMATTAKAGAITAADKIKLDKAAIVEQMTLAEYQALNKVESNTLYICK